MTSTSSASAISFGKFEDGGYDTMYSERGFVLADNVEAGVLQGSANYLIGNRGDNLIIGNAVNNILFGIEGDDVIYGIGGANTLLGGDGNDTLYSGTDNDVLGGGAGDDTYYIDAFDSVIEYAGGGSDTVVTSLASYTLTDNIENGVLSAGGVTLSGNALDNSLTGNDAFNVLFGGDGNDTLSGGGGEDLLVGGTGDDVLTGGTGGDVFWWFETAGFGDIITDFTSGADDLQFSAAAVLQAVGGVLVEGVNFFSSTNPVATTANASFLWDSDDTALYYDADGNGAGEAVLVADMQDGAVVTVDDFIFV